MSFEKIITHVWDESKRKSIVNNILSGVSISIKGLPGALKMLFLSIVSDQLKRPILMVLPNQEDAESATDDLASIAGEENVAFFP